MTKIVDYMILGHENGDELVSIVKAYLVTGWQPFGGVSVAANQDLDTGLYLYEYSQAMVKYEEKENIMDALVGQAVAHTPINPVQGSL